MESRRKYLDQSAKQKDINLLEDHDNTGESNSLMQHNITIMLLDGPPAAMISDADNAITFTSLPIPEGPAMVKRVDYNRYMM